MSNERVDSLYDLMDAAYDSPIIIEHSKSLGHIPIIDVNPRKKGQKAELKLELKAKRVAGYKTSESIRYNQRSSVERVNGRLKDEFGGRMVRVKSHGKVMSHLIVWNCCFNRRSIDEVFRMNGIESLNCCIFHINYHVNGFLWIQNVLFRKNRFFLMN